MTSNSAIARLQEKQAIEGFNVGYELKVARDGMVVYKKRFLELWEAQSMLSSVVFSDMYVNLFERDINCVQVNSIIAQIELTDAEVLELTPPEPIKKSRRK